MWVENLPGNLELLALLNPATAGGIDNVVAHSVPTVTDVVVPGEVMALPKDERRTRIQFLRNAKRWRQENAQRNGSRGGRRESGLTGADVLGALSGVSDLHQLFVFGMCGMLKEGALFEFERLVYARGCELGNSMTGISLDDFRPVFRCAWHDLLNPCTKAGQLRTDVGTLRGLARALGCSTDKARRLRVVYQDSADMLLGIAVGVSGRLSVGLRHAA